MVPFLITHADETPDVNCGMHFGCHLCWGDKRVWTWSGGTVQRVETQSAAAASAQLHPGSLASQASLDGWHGSDSVIDLRTSSNSSTERPSDELDLPGKARFVLTISSGT